MRGGVEEGGVDLFRGVVSEWGITMRVALYTKLSTNRDVRLVPNSRK